MTAIASLTPLEELMVSRQESVDPSAYADEIFDLLSIPAYDKGEPDVIAGREIGSSKKVVEPGDVLLSRIVPHIRRAWVVPDAKGRRQIASGEWIVFRGKAFDSAYLRHLLMSDVFHVQFMNTVAGVGGSLLRARPAYVAKIEIPLPPLSEQKRIADILDKADVIRRKRQEFVPHCDDIVRSAFYKFFGDPTINSKSWAKSQLGDLLHGIDSGWSPTCLDANALPSQWGVLKLGAVTTCKYLDSENKSLPPNETPRPELEVKRGDLLMSRKNTYELVAATVYVHDTRPKLMLPDLVFRFQISRTDLVLPQYLWGLFTEPAKRRQIQRLASGSSGSMPNISKARLNTLDIEIPPIELQQRFSDVVDRVYRSSKTAALLEEQANDLFNSLVQRAFRGDL